ncbi:hypothetical protein ACFXPZ_23370 [Streptomyces sp. NPDC059101]|uniref:hypothetical protein n=1 Tax=unclassified Streptomyces TaxID=2593676 RepID=UPI00369FFCA1
MPETLSVDAAQASPPRRSRRTPALFQAALPIVLMLMLVIPGSIWLRLNPVVLLVVAGSCAGIIAWRLGVTWEATISLGVPTTRSGLE